MALQPQRSAPRCGPGSLPGPGEGDLDELDRLARPTLTRRKDFIDKEEEARKSPNRVLYFRRNADYDRLIEVCSRKIAENPRNVRALLIRASSNLKKGAFGGQSGAVWGSLGSWGAVPSCMGSSRPDAGLQGMQEASRGTRAAALAAAGWGYAVLLSPH
jgi:hypothetical protein